MYSVSAEFLTAMNAPVQEHKVKGTIGSYTFGPGNILSGSFFVTNQCSENNMLGIGQVYIGELGATFRNVGISDGAWVGQIITPVFSLKTENGWEDVPLGVFTIAEATISASGVTVKAYDNMSKFDKAQVGVIEDEYPYDVLSMACTACGVSMTTTRAQIEAMANGTTKVTMSGTVETWRDVVAWMAQALGANATIDRSGYLRIFQYGSTSVATYDDAHRHSGASFADFVTRYTGISLTISATNTTYYYHDTPDDALTMELGANPFLQIGSDNDRQTACENILADLQAVQYSPFNVNLTGCPIYDLGDILTFEDGILSAQKTGCVTFFNYVNHAAYNIKGGGKNPAEASSKSRIDRVVGSLTQTVADQVNQMSVVQNAAAASIADGSEVSVLVYNFEVTEEDNLTMLDVSIAMTSSATETEVGDVYTLADIVAQLHFYVDGSEVSVYDPVFIVDEGKDTMTFNYSLSGLTVGAHELDVRIEMAGGSGAIAADDVHEMLWGYGITFEVYAKSIEVTELPLKTTFFAGQRLDYTGVTISQVYNNGLKDDVTSGSAFDPANGTVLTESDVGTLTVGVSYDTFETSFDLDVELLGFDLVQSANYLWETTPTSMGGDFVLVGTALKAVGITNVAAGLTVQYADVSVASDGTTTITDSGSLSHVFAGNRQGLALKHGNIIYHQWSSNAAYNNEFFEMGYVDLENKTSGDMIVNVVYDADPSATIYALYRYTGNYFAQAFFVGDFLVFPCVKFTINTGHAPLPTYESYAIGVIEGTTITIHIMDASDYTESEFVTKIARGVARDYLWKSTDSGSYKENMINDAEWFVETSGGTINFYHMVCTNYGLSYTLDCTASTEIGDAGATMTKIAGCDMYQISASGRSGLFDPESCEYTEFANNAVAPLAWDENKGMFFKYAMDGNYTKMYLYGSADLQDWVTAEKATSYFNEVGTALFPYNGHLMTIGRNSSASTGNKVPAAIVFEA